MTVIATGANQWLETESAMTIADAGGWGTPLTLTLQGGRVINVADTARADGIRARLGYLPPPPVEIDAAELARHGAETWTARRTGMTGT